MHMTILVHFLTDTHLGVSIAFWLLQMAHFIHVDISAGYAPTHGTAQAQGVCQISLGNTAPLFSKMFYQLMLPPAALESSGCFIRSKCLMFSAFFFHFNHSYGMLQCDFIGIAKITNEVEHLSDAH